MSSQQLVQRLYPYKNMLNKEGCTAVEGVLSVRYNQKSIFWKHSYGRVCVLVWFMKTSLFVEVWAHGWTPYSSSQLNFECDLIRGSWRPCRYYIACCRQRYHLSGICYLCIALILIIKEYPHVYFAGCRSLSWSWLSNSRFQQAPSS